MNLFLCPTCGNALVGFPPASCSCSHIIAVVDGVYQFTDDPALAIDAQGLQWLGYDAVGEHYEPAFALGQDIADFGLFGGCARPLAQMLPPNATALDLGAGLGQAAIPLALVGVRTIAADISQRMMAAAHARAQSHSAPPDHLLCARMNAYHLQLADHSLDAIIEMDLLHQVDHPELVIQQIRRVLKPGGTLAKFSSHGFEYTEEQKQQNACYEAARRDIQGFYENLMGEHPEPTPFDTWQAAADCLATAFFPPEELISDEKISIPWTLEMGLYKTKTRASARQQMIDPAAHDAAWQQTERYATQKYGSTYQSISRTYNMRGVVSLYRLRPQ